MAEEWQQYIFKFKHSGIRLMDLNDETIWSKNRALGRYTAKLGYEVVMAEQDERVNVWWWKSLSKLKVAINLGL